MATKIDYKWPSLLEALKEPARLILLAIVTWIITFIVPQINEPTWNFIILLVLRTADKYLHELGKATNNENMEAGITRF